MQDVLPLGTSVAVHVALVVAGLLIYRTVSQLAETAAPVPVATLAARESTAITRVTLPGGSGQPMAADLAMTPPLGDPAASPFSTAATVASPSAATLFAGHNPAAGAPHGSPFGTATGNAFGIPNGTGTGTGGNGPFPMPASADPRRVVFVCDASGSMLPVFARLKVELNKAIAGLDETDTFNVIFFSDGAPTTAFAEPTFASAANRQRAADFIADAVAAGGTQPIPALRKAMAERPNLVLILTDGFDQVASYDDVAAAVKAGNRDGAATVNCTLLQSGEDPQLTAVLKRIAAENHGSMTVVQKDEF